MPSPFGEDSELCRTLRLAALQFEHRLFLSATPHNGHTRSFTGLLEMLDPVRFTRVSEMSDAMRGRVDDVVIRRLKREIDAGSAAPRFCTRHPPRALMLAADPRETELAAAFDAFRAAVRGLVAGGTKQRRRAGTFAVEILGKRLLSCPTAFAESWRRARQGFADEAAASEAELSAAERALRQETGDDRETQQREATAATVAGAWLKNFAGEVEGEIRRIERALDGLGFDGSDLALDDGAPRSAKPMTEQTPAADARFDALVDLIERLLRERSRLDAEGAGTGGVSRGKGEPEDLRPRLDAERAPPTAEGAESAESNGVLRKEGRQPEVLRPGLDAEYLRYATDNAGGDGGGFRAEERLIVFTEYKTTLDYLARRLRERYPAERVLTLFGAGGSEGMNEAERENVKAAFNDPASPVRILVATDAASEGLNLHRTARYLLHYDCPWNPSRLEQRNGRLDRYGQGRDVTVHHFVSDTDPDLRFLDHVIRKADEIREDLGSVNEIFDRAAHRRLIRGEDAAAVRADLDAGLDAARGRERGRGNAAIGTDAAAALDGEGREGAALLDVMAAEIDLDDRALGDTLEAAMAISGGRPQLRATGEPGFQRVLNPDLRGWRDVIDEAVRRPRSDGTQGSVPRLAFSAEPFIERLGRLSVFQPRRDALLVHLAHPMMQRALGVLARRRYPGEHEVSRWTARRGGVPEDAAAVVLLSVEELAVNELRETFHRWVRTLAFPVRDGAPSAPLSHVPAHGRRCTGGRLDPDDRRRAGELLEDVSADLRRWLREYGNGLSASFRRQLRVDGEAARGREDERYRQRQGEVSALIERSTMARLTREIERLNARARQGQLFDEAERLAEIEQSIAQRDEELTRRRRHYEEVRDQLQRERGRILDHLLPARFAMAGEAQVFPVAVEVRLPERRG